MANAARAFDALGDPTRRAIFERVASRPQSVGKLAERMAVSRPAVSQHLRVLKGAGLVTDRAEGTRRIYSVDLEGVMAMRGYLERFWDGALAAFQAAANAAEDPHHPDPDRPTCDVLPVPEPATPSPDPSSTAK
jgi:DNA-binding transcriptional ArsR family regulator